MGIGDIMAIGVTVALVILSIGVVFSGIMCLRLWLKKQEMAIRINMMKEKLFPEMEAMTNRMMESVIEKTLDSTVKMTQKLQESI